MTKLEITLKADDSFIDAITKLADAVKGKQLKEPIELPAEEAIHESNDPLLATENPVTLQQVRELLAEKSQSGKQAQVKALITKYGVAKLTDIAQDRYADLMLEAEDL